jgi:hypothetical protein
MGGSSTLAAACSTMDNGTYMTVATYLGLSKVELVTEVHFFGWFADTPER